MLGGVRAKRFAVLVTPAAAAALLLVPAIVLGWVSVSIASAEPIGIRTRSGTAGSVFLSASTDTSITSLTTSRGERGVALLHVVDGTLDDLCLKLRSPIPLLARHLAVRVRSSASVHLGQVTLAVGSGGLDGLDLPQTVVGGPAGPDAPGAPSARGAAGFAVRTVSGATTFGDLRTDALGLVLDEGLRLDALSLRVGAGADGC
jgi:hypothetical protein